MSVSSMCRYSAVAAVSCYLVIWATAQTVHGLGGEVEDQPGNTAVTDHGCRDGIRSGCRPELAL